MKFPHNTDAWAAHLENIGWNDDRRDYNVMLLRARYVDRTIQRGENYGMDSDVINRALHADKLDRVTIDEGSCSWLITKGDDGRHYA